MIRALLKKQMLESFSWIYFNRKNGKRRDAKGIILNIALYLLVFGMLGYMFFTMASSLGEPLCQMGLGWLYFAIIGLVAVVLGVFGSVFNTFASLYQAKDNDMLLAMPIPASKILFMRLSGVYLMGLMYELIVMIPSLIVWFMCGTVRPLGIIFSIVITIVLGFFILTLSCVLGWVVALISGKVRNKSFVTVVLSLAFLAAYYYAYSKAYELLLGIVANAQTIADNVKQKVFPLYHMGKAAEGEVVSLLLFVVMVALVFGVVYVILASSFTKLATTNKGAKKVVYKAEYKKAGNADSALLAKELKRFTGSATYMMNCGLGIIFMIIAAVVLVIKKQAIAGMLPELYAEAEDVIPLLVAAAICLILSMNDISAPSVSLEGKNIWLAQVLPVTPWQALKAKLKMHLILTLPPAIVLTACVLYVVALPPVYLIIIPIIVLVFAIFMAMFGLWLNLKAPNLNWTNEVVPIKQSMSVTVALFGGWGIITALGLIYFLLYQYVSVTLFLILVGVVVTALDAVLLYWLKEKGTKIFEKL